MPEVTTPYAPGTPCWVDLMTKDQQAALDLYRDLFGWQGAVGPAEFGGYSVCSLNDKPAAGIMAAMAPEGQPTPPTVWTTYFATADAEATADAVTANGGTLIVPATDVGTLGRMVVAVDPTGAVFGVWQALDFAGAGVANEPGAWTWSELHTGDVDAAGAFYRAVFGAEVSRMEAADDYWSYAVGGRSVAGICRLANDPPGTPPHWLTYFMSDGVDDTVDALVKRGGNVLAPPFDMMAGRMSVLADPQGGTFAVIAPTPT